MSSSRWRGRAHRAGILRESTPKLNVSLGPGKSASLRSRGEVDVAAIADSFGGGGHHNAAGFTFIGGPEDVITRILEQL